MSLLDFLTAYWRVYADAGFYWWQLLLLSAVISAVITVMRRPAGQLPQVILIPVAWIFITALIWIPTLGLAVLGPPAQLFLAWGLFLFLRTRAVVPELRLRGATNDDA